MTPFRSVLSLDQPARYKICVGGRLGENWADHFGDMLFQVETLEDDQMLTHLEGIVPDQAALHGLLNTIRDLGLPLLRVEFIPDIEES